MFSENLDYGKPSLVFRSGIADENKASGDLNRFLLGGTRHCKSTGSG
jgi:hypothetical protein